MPIIHSSWRLYTTSEETISDCQWDVKWIRFYESSDCSSHEIVSDDVTIFSSGGTESDFSMYNVFWSSGIWAGTCINGEYWIGVSFSHEVNINCISVQNGNYHKVNSLKVQKREQGSSVWEDVAFKDNMDTSDQAVNIISLHGPESVSDL